MATANPTLTVTSKGQVTLKRAVLEHLGANPGDRLVVDLLPGGRAEIRAAGRRPVGDLVGMLAREGEAPLTIEQMNEIAAAGWAGEF